jgi:SAM-dependent methyltransferase
MFPLPCPFREFQPVLSSSNPVRSGECFLYFKPQLPTPALGELPSDHCDFLPNHFLEQKSDIYVEIRAMSTSALFDRYYFSRADYVSGTARFHDLVRAFAPPKPFILEVGAGPSNTTSDFLSSLGCVHGIDLDPAVKHNRALSSAMIFDGVRFPFASGVFDLCVSNYVLEHVTNTKTHFGEVFRVLKPGGRFLFRTPNIWHYVTICSRVLPHSFHLRLANRLRSISEGHDPYPTKYRANSKKAIARLASEAGLRIQELQMIEAEPSYGKSSPLLFFPMMAYERAVNRFQILSAFRANILGALTKPTTARTLNRQSI